jgi:hypothetical protein
MAHIVEREEFHVYGEKKVFDSEELEKQKSTLLSALSTNRCLCFG